MFRLALSILSISLLISCGGSSGNLSKSNNNVPSWDYKSIASIDSTHLHGYAYTVGEDSSDARIKVKTVTEANLSTGFDDYLEEIRLKLLSETSDETLNSMQFLSWYRLIPFSAENPTFDIFYPKSSGAEAPIKAYGRMSVPLKSVHEQIVSAFSKSKYKTLFASSTVASNLK